MLDEVALTSVPLVSTHWVDELLLDGDRREVCLWLDGPVDRGTLGAEIARRQDALTRAGLVSGGSVALRMPPSLPFVANLLAAWRIGAQVSLLDHRLTQFEVDAALDRVGAQFVVEPIDPISTALRGFHVIVDDIRALGGRPAQTDHALIQFSSGSTGPSKVIGRTASDLIAEIDRYTRIDGVPQPGERIVLLASMVHVLGLVGGLLYGLHARVQLRLPERLTADSVLRAIAADPTPTTVLGVPVYINLLAAVADPPLLPQFVRMTTGGELVRPGVPERFADRYGAVLANMYGMTEVGVIATDLSGTNRPALRPAPGIDVRVVDGELQIGRARTPYVGLADESRWVDGWLRTKDAAALDPVTGLLTIQGRLDSQVSIGGLKVDLTEVEQSVAELPGVAEAVVAFDGSIQVYAALRDGATVAEQERALAERLAPYKRPRLWHVVDQLPRTSSGKLLRDLSALRRSTERPASP